MRSDFKPITIYITEDMWRIIERRRISPPSQYELVQLFASFVNKWMLSIAAKLGITQKITTYVARHTFSNVLNRSGASTEFIQ